MRSTLSINGGMFLVLSVAYASGCGGYGPKVRNGAFEVHYTDGATEAEAQRVAALLAKQPLPDNSLRSVQLRKAGDGYQLRFVVRQDFRDKADTATALQFDAARVSRDAMGGAAVEVHICDERFNTLQILPPRADMRYGVVEGKCEVFCASLEDKKDAQRLAKFVVHELKVPITVNMKIARRAGLVELHMVSIKGVEKNEHLQAALRQDARAVSAGVFGGLPVEMHLCDDHFRVVHVLEP